MRATLPRDTRDTLFLLGVIAWIIAPHIPNLPWWCSLLAVVVLAWRAWLAWQTKPLPSKWWLVGLLLLTLGATLATHRTLLGRDAGVTLIVVLLALKTLELRARRDAFVVFFLGFFTLLTHFFFSQSLLTAAAMLVALLGLLTALVNAHMPVGQPPLKTSIRIAGQMALLGAPIMLVLFMLFPRLAPLWGVPSDAMTGRSGLSGSMKVGSIASLALDETIALRAKFEGEPPPQQFQYWRGPVLSSFDGSTWESRDIRNSQRVGLPANLVVSGEPLRYEVTMEPSQRPWLMLLEAATTEPKVPGYEVAMTQSLQWFTNRPISDLLRYKVESYTNFTHGPLQLRGAQTYNMQEYVQLPPGFNPRTLEMAAQMRREPALANANGEVLAQAVLQRLKTGGYEYTLEPGVYGQHTADEFWFDRKAGFCEHIASSFVILMRALDVPARIVTGYQGGSANSVDGYWIVRQADAHAWAEIWVAGKGWLRVDPTGAVAPGRIGAFERLVAPQGVFGQAVGAINPTLAKQLRAVWDAMNNSWNQWVLNYSQAKQLNLLKNLGLNNPSWHDLGYVLIGIIVLVSLAGALWAWWERSQHDPWLRLLHSAKKRLARAGLATSASTPPRTLAAQVRTQFGAQGEAIAAWLLKLEAFRYENVSTSAQSLGTLRSSYRQLAWPAAQK
jgi:protein-glutamine gamma-glutamyltransferase